MNSEGNDGNITDNPNITFDLPLIYDANSRDMNESHDDTFSRGQSNASLMNTSQSKLLKKPRSAQSFTDSQSNPPPEPQLTNIMMSEKDILLEMDNQKAYTIDDLLCACKENNLEEIEKIHNYGIGLNSRSLENDKCAFQIACEYGHVDVIDLLVRLEVDIYVEDKHKRTATHIAAEKGHIEVLEYLQHLDLSLEARDDMLKTPLHYACEAGKYNVVEYLISQHAALRARDIFNRTALHFSAEKGHLSILQLLIQRDGDDRGSILHEKNSPTTVLHSACRDGQLEIVKYLVEAKDVTIDCLDRKLRLPVHVAAKFGFATIVEYLVKRDPSTLHSLAADSRNLLHFACMCPSDNRNSLRQLVEFLLSQQVDKEARGGKLRVTPFLYACKFSTLEVVKCLVDADVHYFSVDDNRSNALHYACDGGNVEIVKYLLKELEFDINGVNNGSWIPITFAANREQYNVVKFLIKAGSKVDAINETEEGLINILAPNLSKQDGLQAKRVAVMLDVIRTDTLGRLDKLAEVCGYLMDTLDLKVIASGLVRYMEKLPSAIAFLNEQLSGNESGDDSKFMQVFKHHLYKQDPCLLFHILKLIRGLEKAAEAHYTERPDILDVRRKFEVMANEIFACSCFDEIDIALRIIVPEMYMSGHKPNDLSAFEVRSIIMYSLERSIPIVFDKPQVNNLVERVFYSVLKTRVSSKANPSQYHGFSFYIYSFPLIHFLADSITDSKKQEAHDEHAGKDHIELEQRDYLKSIKYSHALRTNPGIMMFFEFVSKSILLALVAIVSREYSIVYGIDYSRYPDDEQELFQLNNFSVSEYWLLVIAVMDMIFEIGQMIEDGMESISLANIIQDEWNFLDRISSGFLIVWIILRFAAISQLPSARVVLAVTAMPMSIGLLRYLSVYEPLGELVILIKAMTTQIFNVIIVYIVCVIGFGVTFYSLFFSMNELYSTPGFMLLTLFQNTLNNVVFDGFLTNNDSVNILGILLLVIFLVFTSIVLMNLLIAQMSSSYAIMKEQSVQAWSFMYAKLVAEYMLLEERHVFCLLPAPFNIFTILLGPWHYFGFRFHGLSVGGTFANILISYTAGAVCRTRHHLEHAHETYMKTLPALFEKAHKNQFFRFGYSFAYIMVVFVLILVDIILLPWIILGIEIFSNSIVGHEDELLSKEYPDKRHCIHLCIEYVSKDGKIYYPDLNEYEHELKREHSTNSRLFEDEDDGCITATTSEGLPVRKLHRRASSVRRTPSAHTHLSTGKSISEKETSDLSVEESMIYYPEIDIQRIVRPLKSYIKSLNTTELLRLESNVSQETLRLRNDIGGIVEKEMFKVKTETKVGQDILKHELVRAQNKFTIRVNDRIDQSRNNVITQIQANKLDFQKSIGSLEDKLNLVLFDEIVHPQHERHQSLEQLMSNALKTTTMKMTQEAEKTKQQLNELQKDLHQQVERSDDLTQRRLQKEVTILQENFHSDFTHLDEKVHEIECKVNDMQASLNGMEKSLGEVSRLVKMIAMKTAVNLIPKTTPVKEPILMFDVETQTIVDRTRSVDKSLQTKEIEVNSISCQTLPEFEKQLEPTKLTSQSPPAIVLPMTITIPQITTLSEDAEEVMVQTLSDTLLPIANTPKETSFPLSPTTTTTTALQLVVSPARSRIVRDTASTDTVEDIIPTNTILSPSQQPPVSTTSTTTTTTNTTTLTTSASSKSSSSFHNTKEQQQESVVISTSLELDNVNNSNSNNNSSSHDLFRPSRHHHYHTEETSPVTTPNHHNHSNYHNHNSSNNALSPKSPLSPSTSSSSLERKKSFIDGNKPMWRR